MCVFGCLENTQSKDFIKACDKVWWLGDRHLLAGDKGKGGDVCMGRLYLVLDWHDGLKRGQNALAREASNKKQNKTLKKVFGGDRRVSLLVQS